MKSKSKAKQAQSKLYEGMGHHQNGRLDLAKASYEQALRLQPDQFDALHLLGVIAAQTNNFEQAIDLFDKAISIYPHDAAFYFNRGNAQKILGRFSDALENYNRAIKLNVNYAEAYLNRGDVLTELEHPEEGLASYGQAIKIQPGYAEAYVGRCKALTNLSRLDEALASCDQAIKLKSGLVEAHIVRGNILQELKRFDDALACYEQAIELRSNYAATYNYRGNALKDLQRLDEALASYDRAIELKANYAEAFNNRGITLQELNRFNEALTSYDRAIEINEKYAKAHNNRGNVLKQLGRTEGALASYDQAIKINMNFAEAHHNRGLALSDLRRFEEALTSYEEAIRLKEDFVAAHNNRGLILHELKRFDEALDSYDHTIRIKADYAEAHYNRGALLQERKQLEDAVLSFETALAVNPDFRFIKGALLHAKMLCCDWEGLQLLKSTIDEDVISAIKSATPFGYQAISESEEQLLSCAVIYCNYFFPELHREYPKSARKKDKIHIGYLSGEFRTQATSLLMANLFELHDKDHFKIFAFDNGWDDGSETRRRINNAFDEVIDISRQDDATAAQEINAREIDILVNLNGYFGTGRQGVFAMRPSPIQINYLGFPGTLGANYIDYLIADKVIIPPNSRQFYSEKIVYLPNSYQVNDSKRVISGRQFTREELDLPSSGFVFCCFNNNYKITPDTFDCWMRILKQVAGGVLWLFEDNPAASKNLRREAERRGIDGSRLIFAKRMPPDEHLARHRLAGLFLDTLPYNAHTTASDALWAGLPLLTCIGKTFPGRVAASLLEAIGLPELITTNQQQYEAMAVELATNPVKLNHIREKLQRNRLSAPLFDTGLFTKHLEVSYKQMYERYHADLPPVHMAVETAGALGT